MDFLPDLCEGSLPCSRDAQMVHPAEPLRAGVWMAYEPFHIRHGFVNPQDVALGSAFPPDFDVEVFVTRVDGPAQ